MTTSAITYIYMSRKVFEQHVEILESKDLGPEDIEDVPNFPGVVGLYYGEDMDPEEDVIEPLIAYCQENDGIRFCGYHESHPGYHPAYLFFYDGVSSEASYISCDEEGNPAVPGFSALVSHQHPEDFDVWKKSAEELVKLWEERVKECRQFVLDYAQVFQSLDH